MQIVKIFIHVKGRHVYTKYLFIDILTLTTTYFVRILTNKSTRKNKSSKVSRYQNIKPVNIYYYSTNHVPYPILLDRRVYLEFSKWKKKNYIKITLRKLGTVRYSTTLLDRHNFFNFRIWKRRKGVSTKLSESEKTLNK